jgi:hypothetical protein
VDAAVADAAEGVRGANSTSTLHLPYHIIYMDMVLEASVAFDVNSQEAFNFQQRELNELLQLLQDIDLGRISRPRWAWYQADFAVRCMNDSYFEGIENAISRARETEAAPREDQVDINALRPVKDLIIDVSRALRLIA